VKQVLRKSGRPIPQNDLWFAAIAIEHDMTLVTRDKHFGEIPGLRVSAW
jgi:tRNA(fMet)-specific endonuclease VapC